MPLNCGGESTFDETLSNDETVAETLTNFDSPETQTNSHSSMTNKPNVRRTGTLHSKPLTLRKDVGELDSLVCEDLRPIPSHPSILDAWHLPEDSCKRSRDRWLLGHIQNDRYHRMNLVSFQGGFRLQTILEALEPSRWSRSRRSTTNAGGGYLYRARRFTLEKV